MCELEPGKMRQQWFTLREQQFFPLRESNGGVAKAKEVGHNYTGHNYIGHNYNRGEAKANEEDPQRVAQA